MRRNQAPGSGTESAFVPGIRRSCLGSSLALEVQDDDLLCVEERRNRLCDLDQSLCLEANENFLDLILFDARVAVKKFDIKWRVGMGADGFWRFIVVFSGESDRHQRELLVLVEIVPVHRSSHFDASHEHAPLAVG